MTIARNKALHARKVPVVVGTTLIGAAAEVFEKNKLPAVSVLINAIMNLAGQPEDRGFRPPYSRKVGGKQQCLRTSNHKDLPFDHPPSFSPGPNGWTTPCIFVDPIAHLWLLSASDLPPKNWSRHTVSLWLVLIEALSLHWQCSMFNVVHEAAPGSAVAEVAIVLSGEEVRFFLVP
jgi:hypothetical protein